MSLELCTLLEAEQMLADRCWLEFSLNRYEVSVSVAEQRKIYPALSSSRDYNELTR